MDTVSEDLRRICRKHLGALRTLVVQRRNRGPLSAPLPSVVDVERDPSESDEDLLSSIVDDTLAIIRRDALKPRGRNTPNAGTIAQWEGDVILLGDAVVDEKKKAKPRDDSKPARQKELDRLPIEIEDPEAMAQTIESQTVAIMKEARLLLAGERAGIVSIYDALGRREKHQAKMFKSMAQGQASTSKGTAKYHYLERREAEQTEREDIAARERTAKRNFFWSAVETFGENWHDVGEIWSRYYTQGRKPGDPPKPAPTKPTPDECDRIFGGTHSETFEKVYDTSEGKQSIRSVVAQMIAEPDFERRRAWTKVFLQVGMQIPNAKNVLKQALLEHVDEDRAQAIIAWIALPVSF